MKIVPMRNVILVTRSAFCKECWQKERPKKGDRFMLFGGSAQIFKERYAHVDGIGGFTPHLYSVEFPYRLDEDGLVIANKTCLMDSCGIFIGPLRKDGKFTVEFLNVTPTKLSVVSADALISLWRRTGYELL